ncbi:DegT/DnrJ/EryC1/StrS family aminotransferase [Idiomarina loihiensis]|uniref:DegT/DnrJ/EryC1/StrS family aminotransferase n=1 Tax=Idiomarina loihiensis TaxID=135577 RepID=UPI00129C6DA9|nr:DegT/DnrJ/EryC1/StrS family aminotransferase [Idiomarina loihiensis]MRJ45171.1 DegT/DnrJ/EryC1/StrS family aminotransferase [Idiomarina loihiensis]UTW32143.1 DegT/DnrJ/EryC1/StrS family aminotransferase [Idiomarina loihiensis]
MIPVSKPYLPNRDELNKYIDGIYERRLLTNNGPLAQELTARLEKYLGVENLLLVSNGTLALQVAYRALGITNSSPNGQGEAITTPFTFVATASSLKWDGVEPVFADIDSETWCLDPERIEAVVTSRTRAIVPVHVFGNACEVEEIGSVAAKHNLKVIYDASHAFGVTYKGESLLRYGDAATLSFHATKLFHTIEGGAIVFKRKEDLERAKKMINFGLAGPEVVDEIGINAKMNEFQAAMGLCVLDEMDTNLASRSRVWHKYKKSFKDKLQLQKTNSDISYNFAYFPVVFGSEKEALKVAGVLGQSDVIARRYFFPPLDNVKLFNSLSRNEFSQDISKRILCLPLYSDLEDESIELIIKKVNEAL